MRGKRNAVLRSLENVENELKDITQNFDSRDVSLVDRLSGLKYSHEDKIKKVKLIDEELLNLLEPKEYEVEYEKILKREDISFQVIARVERCLKQSTVENNFTFSPRPSTTPTPVEEISCKLPKLVISPFDGNTLNWTTFWDQFESSIHSKRGISDIDKFSYLRSFLAPVALETISGLTLSSQNYSEAIDLLKNRYGNPQTLINSYMEQFVNLETVTKTNDVIRLRKLFNKVENSMRNLRSLGVDSDNYGKLLVPVLNSKLPSDMRTLFARTFCGKVWDLDEMLKIFRCELEAKEQASLTVKAEKSYEKSRENYTTGALYSASKLSNYQASSRNPASGSRNNNKSCLFCQGNHPRFRCTKVTDPKIRKDLIFKNSLCFICLDDLHIASKCTSSNSCKKCEGCHSISICSKDFKNDHQNSNGSKNSQDSQNQSPHQN